MGVQCGGAGLPRRPKPKSWLRTRFSRTGERHCQEKLLGQNFMAASWWLPNQTSVTKPLLHICHTKEGTKNAPDNRKNLNPIFITYKTNE